MDLIENQAYQLKDDIDQAVFRNITAKSAGTFIYATTATPGTIVTGSAVTAANPIKIHAADSTTAAASPILLFSRARKELRALNVEEAGDWAAVIDPAVAQIIEMIGAEKGFSVADATLRNGYAGNFLGFKIYISNNLPSKWAYFGKTKRIGLVVQMPPRVRIKDVPNKLGVNIVTSIVYGTHVFNKNAQRFLSVNVET